MKEWVILNNRTMTWVSFDTQDEVLEYFKENATDKEYLTIYNRFNGVVCFNEVNVPYNYRDYNAFKMLKFNLGIFTDGEYENGTLDKDFPEEYGITFEKLIDRHSPNYILEEIKEAVNRSQEHFDEVEDNYYEFYENAVMSVMKQLKENKEKL